MEMGRAEKTLGLIAALLNGKPVIDSWRTSQAGGLRKLTRTEDGRVRVSALADDCPC